MKTLCLKILNTLVLIMFETLFDDDTFWTMRYLYVQLFSRQPHASSSAIERPLRQPSSGTLSEYPMLITRPVGVYRGNGRTREYKVTASMIWQARQSCTLRPTVRDLPTLLLRHHVPQKSSAWSERTLLESQTSEHD